MIFADVTKTISKELNINKFRGDVARSYLTKYSFVPKGRNIYHEDDICYLIFGMVIAPKTYKDAEKLYQQMDEHAESILNGFKKIVLIEEIDSITFGSCYMIVTCTDKAKSFISGSMIDKFTDRSFTISGNKFWDIYNKIKKL